MRVKIIKAEDGPGPSEAIVTIRTTSENEEEVIVHKDQIQEGTIEVGHVGHEDDRFLVELPQESAIGNWRIWVSSENIQ